MSAPLADCRVLVTRPAHQAGGLLRLIEEAGGQPLPLPMQVIEYASAGVINTQQLSAPADWWVFTSANAVHGWHRLGMPPPPVNIAAIGPATAQALEDLGLVVDLVPEPHSSEGLLATAPFVAPKGLRVLVLAGEGGRDLIARHLSERGAELRQLALYRRAPSAVTPDAAAAAVSDCDAVVVTNGEALTRLYRLTPEPQRPCLLSRQLVVPSERVVEQALSLGFVEPARVPAQINDAQLVRTLIEWRRNPSATG